MTHCFIPSSSTVSKKQNKKNHTMDKNSSEDKGSNHSNQVPYTCKMQLLADQDAVLFHLTILQHNAVE